MISAKTVINAMRYCENLDELNCVFQLYIRVSRLDLERVKRFYDARRSELCAPVADQIISFPAGRPVKGGEAHVPVQCLRR